MARVALEPAPSATLLLAEAVLLLPMATALLPEAVALPSTTQLSITLLLSTTQLALPPTSTDCASAAGATAAMPTPSVNAMAADSSEAARASVDRRWSMTTPADWLLANSEATTICPSALFQTLR
ncbi:hypothetical protein D3C86_607680 [compost metagenome]